MTYCPPFSLELCFSNKLTVKKPTLFLKYCLRLFYAMRYKNIISSMWSNIFIYMLNKKKIKQIYISINLISSQDEKPESKVIEISKHYEPEIIFYKIKVIFL